MANEITAVYSPQTMAALVRGGFANLPVLFGSSVVVIDPTMPHGAEKIGQTVDIPYASVPTKWQIRNDGQALDPITLKIGNAAGSSTTPESATVVRAGTLFNPTTWFKSNPLDPYGEGLRQMRAGLTIAWEEKLIATAADPTNWTSYTVDEYDATTPNFISMDHFIDVKVPFGQAAYRDGFRMVVMHSHIAADCQKVRDAIGRQFVQRVPRSPETPTGFVLEDGTPVMVTDAPGMTIDPGGGNPLKYVTICLRARALALYVNPSVSYMRRDVPAEDRTEEALNTYLAAHRYHRVDGDAYPGAGLIITNSRVGI